MQMNIEELNNLRIIDLIKLIKIRAQSNYNFEEKTKRDFLFILAICLSHLLYEDAQKKYEEICKIIKCDSKSYILNISTKLKYWCHFYQVIGKTRYKITSEYIIAQLNLSDTELEKLQAIVSIEMKEAKYLKNELEKQSD